jgi:hypothetical protein
LTRLVPIVAAAVLLAGCGGGGGGQIQRVEVVQQCLKRKQLPTNVTRGAQLPGSSEHADLLDTELLSPSAARLYVFDSVDAAKSAADAAGGEHERRDNVVIRYAHQPTDEDRAALDECFSGKF